MKLESATVGPIVGHTTHDEARIWLRGLLERTGDGHRHCFAVAQLRKKGEEPWSAPIINKMTPTFDMTAVLVFQNLSAATDYEYRAGWLLADGDLNAVAAALKALPKQSIFWPREKYTFRTRAGDDKASGSYVVGSCRYLLRLLGGALFDDRGDKTFGSIRAQHLSKPLDALLMIGDQIYADDLSFVNPDVKLEQFLARYREAFTQPQLRALMSSLSTYMILDDHEIEDNWPSRATTRDRITTYPQAIHAYQIYQCSHSPLFTARADGRIDGTPDKFWYRFSHGCSDWFVMDSRTERDVHATPKRMIDREQMDALLAWLAEGQERVKMIVTSVPMLPDLVRDGEDKWGAFPDDRKRILDTIAQLKLRKVVFVSGDVHCSFVAKLTSASDPAFQVHAVVSSSFFWPYPHMRQRDFWFGQPLKGMGQAQLTPELKSKVVNDDNFARLDVSETKIEVGFFARKGEPLEHATITF